MNMALSCLEEPTWMATVLVVDDEPCFREVVGDILTAAGHRILSAPDVEEAFAAIRREKPRVILTDQMMPKVDGLTFVQRLRANPGWADIHVIVVSAKARRDDIDRALQAGADEYLVKPFSADELRAVLERACQSAAG
jgi:two-component system chemotaxis response regulator CheY